MKSFVLPSQRWWQCDVDDNYLNGCPEITAANSQQLPYNLAPESYAMRKARALKRKTSYIGCEEEYTEKYKNVHVAFNINLLINLFS